MCARCAELEDEVKELRRDLGYESDTQAVLKIKKALRIEPQQARLLAILYRRKGAAVLYDALMGPLESESEEPKRILFTHFCRLNKRIGGERLVENVYGFGYRMTPAGMAALDSALAA